MLLCGRSLFYLAFVLIICWTFGFTPIFRRSQQEQHDLQRKRQSPSSVSESVVERDAARLTYNKAPISVEINTVIVTGAGALNTPTHRDEDIRFEHVLMEVPYPDLARKASLVSREPILPEINKDIVEFYCPMCGHQRAQMFVEASLKQRFSELQRAREQELQRERASESKPELETEPKQAPAQELIAGRESQL